MNENFSVEAFVDYCDDMMIAEEGLLDKIYHNDKLSEIKAKLKAGEKKFTCNMNFDGRNVPCTVDISKYTGTFFKSTILLGKLRSILNSKKYIQEALNYQYYDKTGSIFSKKGDRIKDMKYYWTEMSLSCDRRGNPYIGGKIYFENKKKEINYDEIRSLVEQYIKDAEIAAANANAAQANALAFLAGMN